MSRTSPNNDEIEGQADMATEGSSSFIFYDYD